MYADSTQIKIQNKFHDLLVMVRSKFPTQLSSMMDPTLTFNLKGTIGGQADRNAWELRFNLELAEKNLEYYLNQVVAHEFAHLLDYMFYKNYGHGRTWKNIMRSVFGLTPDRCHEMDVSEVKMKKYDTYLYSCRCGIEHKIKPNRHKKIQGLKAMVACASCRQILKFEKYIGKT